MAGESENRYHVAGFWRRVAAGAVDAIVLAPVVLMVGGLTASAGGEPLPRLGELGPGYAVHLALDGGVAGPAALAMGALVAGLYFFIFHALRGQTVGKRLLGLRVIDAWGVRPSAGRALARTLGYVVSAALCSLGFLWIGFDREKRGLHDWLAGTYVVRVARAGATSTATAGATS